MSTKPTTSLALSGASCSHHDWLGRIRSTGGLTRLAPELYDDEMRQRISEISGVTFRDYLAA